MNARKKRRKELERPTRDLKRFTRKWRRKGRMHGKPALASTINHLIWEDMLKRSQERWSTVVSQWVSLAFKEVANVQEKDIEVGWDDGSGETP